MIETVLQDGDVVVRAHGALRRITLNRPQALNAITLDMVVTMTALLRAWADDPAVGAILLDGAGGRAFAAGGDIRALYDAAKAGDKKLPEKFWATEYRLNVLIARYPKPVIALMDGVVMGGGVGLSAHASHRIVTERSSVAMPEVAIGYFPDVGACFLLARAPGSVGTYLALTGARAAAADAIYCGLADLHIPAARLDELPAALADCRGHHDAKARLDKFSGAARGRPPRRGAVLDRSLLWRGQRRGDFRTVGAIRRRRGARGARNHAQNVADLAQDHIAKHQVGAIIRAGRAELSAGLSRVARLRRRT